MWRWAITTSTMIDWELPRCLPWEKPGYEVERIRADFPILSRSINGKPLIWLDNAATTQKPRQVIRRLQQFYEEENSNVHRGAHPLAERATDAYEGSRERVSSFLHAASPQEIVFVRGATEGINLVAQTYGRSVVRKGDQVLVSQLEHHANLVPWQVLCREQGAYLRIIPIDDQGKIDLEHYQQLLEAPSPTKIVALTQVSNVLGSVTPVAEMTRMAHGAGAVVLVDGAQAAAHVPVDVVLLDCDFYVFSGHKLYGPTGIGALYGKQSLLQQMVPYQSGGNMIYQVTEEEATFQDPPHRFEAGTGNIADAVGLGAAIEYFLSLGLDRVFHHERKLIAHAELALSQIKGIRLLGRESEQVGGPDLVCDYDRVGVLPFVMDGISNEAVGQHLSQHGIAVRTGHHCAQPLLRRFGLDGVVRPSFALYNTFQEIDVLVEALQKLRQRHPCRR